MAFPDINPIGYDLSGLGFSGTSRACALQRQFQWQLFMPHVINGVSGPYVSSFCQDVRIGNYSIAQLSRIQYGAFQRHFVGLQNIRSIPLTFLVPIDNTVTDFFRDWYHLGIDEDGYYYPSIRYKKQIFVSLYDRSGVESMQLKISGAFPSTQPDIDLSFAADDVLRINIVLSVDRIESHSLIGNLGLTGAVGSIAQKTKELLGDTGGIAQSGIVTESGNLLL